MSMNKRWGVVKIKGYWYAFEDTKFLGLFWSRVWIDNFVPKLTWRFFNTAETEGKHHSRADAERSVERRKRYLKEKEKEDQSKDNSEEYIL